MAFSLRPTATAIGLYRRMKASLWFTPALWVLGGIGLVSLFVTVGPQLPDPVLGLFPAAESDTVRAMLQLLASSTLTVATVTFSILMVVLTMTASTFSPRALSGFMRDGVNQNTLGIFLGGFAFGVTGILLLRLASYSEHFLGLFVLVAMAVAFTVLGALVYFIHHTATEVQITNLVLRLHKEAEAVLTRFLAMEKAGREQARGLAMLPSDPPGAVNALAAGYVEVLDQDRLLALAAQHDLVLRVTRRAGEFATGGMPLCHAWPADRLTEAAADGIRSAYAVGAQRTTESDPLLGMELLAEIAVRALSPGINDPNTAVNCLNYLGDLLVRIARHDLPRLAMHDEEGRLRLVIATPDFRAFLERSLLGIAGAGAGHVQVVLALLGVLHDIATVTQDRARRTLIGQTARAIATLSLDQLALEREREQLQEALETLESVLAARSDPTAPSLKAASAG